MATVTVETPGAAIPAHLATPAGEGPWPGVLVIHDALGMTEDLRSQAAWLADHGYLALAPDLYHRGRRVPCMFSTLKALASGSGDVFEDLEAARNWLASRPDCSGRIGVMGFCMGGNFALLLAGSGQFDASSVNYGDIDTDRLDVLSNACPIIASYGGRDRSLRRTPERLERTLTVLGVEHDVEVYPQAGHGFLNDHTGELPLWALVAGWYARTGYDEGASRDARRRILAFFDRHLGE